ncbi:MAG: imidazole glycerol phosphate synthase subunit HisH [Planctomycetota bacterium]
MRAIAILDYGMGNLRSVQKALQHVGHDAEIVDDARGVEDAARLILPGVGNFADGMRQLQRRGLINPIQAFADSGRPMMGVCLGMQLLFDSSTEDAPQEAPIAGLGLIAGRVVRFRENQGQDQPRLKVPHMGWNTIQFTQTGAALGERLPDDPHVYFVHGYYCRPSDEKNIAANTTYGVTEAATFCSAVHCGNLWATQFHPEKSQAVGLQLLDNFARWSA